LMIVTTLFAVLSAAGLFRVELVARQVVLENEPAQTSENNVTETVNETQETAAGNVYAVAEETSDRLEVKNSPTPIYQLYYIGDLAGKPDDQSETALLYGGYRSTPDYAKMKAVIKHIQTNAAPKSWNEEATIKQFVATTTLVIKQTEDVHKQIAKALNHLRTEDPEFAHRLGPGDTIGIYIEGLTGAPDQPIPVHKLWPEEFNMPPATGYPFTVRDDGTIALPKMLHSLNVEGLTVKETEALIYRAYVEVLRILEPDKTITVSLIRPRIVRVFITDSPYRLGPGDTLGIYIEGITGDPDQPIPIHHPDNLPPATGYPYTIRDDGTIALPKIPSPLNVEGLTLAEAHVLIFRTYVEVTQILEPDKVITISLIRPRAARVTTR